MKLLYCTRCQDVVRLVRTDRHCDCGSCGGRYTDGINAIFWGTAIPLGISWTTFAAALKAQPEGPGLGECFEAFVIPEVCDTMEKIQLPEVKRRPGVPSRGQMYKILKQRSLELQGGSDE